MTLFGHAGMQTPQPLHLSISITIAPFAIMFFFNYLYVDLLFY